MGYETSQFGDGVSTTRVTNVNNHYGPRDSEWVNGVNKTEGFSEELVIEFTGETVSDAAFPLLAPSLPAGAVPRVAIVEVVEAFVLGGTSPTINVGTEGSEGTNGVEISEAQAEAVGTYDITGTLAGTWASPLAAATTVGIATDGTSPTVTAAGKAKLIIKYDVVKGARA